MNDWKYRLLLVCLTDEAQILMPLEGAFDSRHSILRDYLESSRTGLISPTDKQEILLIDEM